MSDFQGEREGMGCWAPHLVTVVLLDWGEVLLDSEEPGGHLCNILSRDLLSIHSLHVPLYLICPPALYARESF